MEKEQIVKALEHCIDRKDCSNCVIKNQISGFACLGRPREFFKNALALINSQEQRIKELTEENERLKEIPEQLHKEMSERMVEERKIERKLSVRKMQTRFKELMGTEIASCGYCNAVGYWSVKTVKENIARVANEILNVNAEEIDSLKEKFEGEG